MKRVLCLALALILLPACAPSIIKNAVSTSGSSSMDQVVGALNEQFMRDHPDLRVTYDPTGSGAGIQAAKTGASDFGLSSRELKESELAELTATPLALDGIAVVVSLENPVENLPLDQLYSLFTGRIHRWDALGGSGPVAAIGREGGSGTRSGFAKATGVEEDARYHQELTSAGAVLEAVRANPHAVGYVSVAALDDTVKAVTVDGVPCTPETVVDGSYPIGQTFYIVTRKGAELSPQAALWLDFVTSDAAFDVIRGAGAIPVAG